MWHCTGAQAGAGAQARASGARGRGAWGAQGKGHGRWACGLGVLLGQQAVHSMHSACFDPVSTQYCS